MTGVSADGRPAAEHPGWYLLAWAEEITGDLTPFTVGRRALVAVRRDDTIAVFDAVCPHRGANLGYGGELRGGCVVCPFHGRRVELGENAKTPAANRVREYPSFQVGSAIFVRLSPADDHDHGFEAAMREIATTRQVLTGFTIPITVPAELVIENAFDIDHFRVVHGISRFVGATLKQHEAGELAISGALETLEAAPWQSPTDGPSRTRFHARAFSPTLVLTELGPEGEAPVVLTGTTPVPGGCVARVGFAVRPDRPGIDPPRHIVEALVDGGRHAFEQDVVVWEHIDLDRPPEFDIRDGAVLAFQGFCSTFTR